MATKKKVVAKKATTKKIPLKKVAPVKKEVEVKAPKIVSKSQEKRIKMQKETPNYPTVDGLKVVEILDGSTATDKNCMMSDGTTRFVEIERFDK